MKLFPIRARKIIHAKLHFYEKLIPFVGVEN